MYEDSNATSGTVKCWTSCYTARYQKMGKITRRFNIAMAQIISVSLTPRLDRVTSRKHWNRSFAVYLKDIYLQGVWPCIAFIFHAQHYQQPLTCSHSMCEEYRSHACYYRCLGRLIDSYSASKETRRNFTEFRTINIRLHPTPIVKFREVICLISCARPRPLTIFSIGENLERSSIICFPAHKSPGLFMVFGYGLLFFRGGNVFQKRGHPCCV